MDSDKIVSLDAYRNDPEGAKKIERSKKKTELLDRLSTEQVGLTAAEESIADYTRQLTELQAADTQVVEMTRDTQIEYLESTIRSFERERDGYKKQIEQIQEELKKIEMETP